MSDRVELLVEIGTEELPPKSLRRLAQALADKLVAGLVDAEITDTDHVSTVLFAAPRRLGVRLGGLLARQPDIPIEKRGPSLQAARDEAGNPTKAALGFARSCGVQVSDLDVVDSDKGSYLLYRGTRTGQHSEDLVADLLERSLKQLPAERWMRWGKGNNAEFVRPVHWLVVLLGEEVVPVRLYGIESGRDSRGHRFHHPSRVPLGKPAEYAETLRRAFVVADYDERRQLVRDAVERAAAQAGGVAVIQDGLLDEVCSLLEWPCPVTGCFDQEFLRVPEEVLIASMQGHQKYFPVRDSAGHLMARFITLSNTQCADMTPVRSGNERVLRARLSDARYFYEVDRNQGLDPMAEKLDGIVFQEQLGSLADKTGRLTALALEMARQIGLDSALTGRAARLCKADLMSLMVGEFAELQGVMGGRYAEAMGEPPEVARAIAEHYRPAFSGDRLPDSRIGMVLSLADKLDTLVGIFAIGQSPTGEKDPFALRRAALGCLRVLIEGKLPLDLAELLRFGCAQLPDAERFVDVPEKVLDFMLERLRGYYDERLFAHDEIDAVFAVRPTDMLDLDQRLRALSAFREEPAAASLIGADKRIRNLLNKTELPVTARIKEEVLQEPAEQRLYETLCGVSKAIAPLREQRDYLAICQRLALLREPVDAFFEQVMVMVDHRPLRRNRLALLQRLRGLFLTVADLSQLQH